jgi:hypothetical protein
MTDKIISITKKCLENSERLSDVCKKIRENIYSEFIGTWNFIARYGDNGICNQLCHAHFLIDLKFEKLLIRIIKAYDKVYI